MYLTVAHRTCRQLGEGKVLIDIGRYFINILPCGTHDISLLLQGTFLMDTGHYLTEYIALWYTGYTDLLLQETVCVDSEQYFISIFKNILHSYLQDIQALS